VRLIALPGKAAHFCAGIKRKNAAAGNFTRGFGPREGVKASGGHLENICSPYGFEPGLLAFCQPLKRLLEG